MKQSPVRENIRGKIDVRVDRILRELGNPPPPLKLEDVRLLLKLNRNYFSGDDESLAAQTISRLTVASKQVIRRPMLLFEAAKKFSLKALYLPDRKQILIDSDVPVKKHRWLEAHEIGHGLLPWHEPFMFGDNDHTPTPACHDKLEAEANYAAGQLIFLRRHFLESAQGLPIDRTAFVEPPGVRVWAGC